MVFLMAEASVFKHTKKVSGRTNNLEEVKKLENDENQEDEIGEEEIVRALHGEEGGGGATEEGLDGDCQHGYAKKVEKGMCIWSESKKCQREIANKYYRCPRSKKGMYDTL